MARNNKSSEEKSKKISETIGNVAAMKTALYNFPIESQLSNFINTGSIDLVTLLFSIFGISEDELINFLFRLIGCEQEASEGGGISNTLNNFSTKNQKFLKIVETTIKTLLLLNLKKMFTCSATPFITNDMLYEYTPIGQEGTIRGNGIDISLDEIDTFGKLNNCPTDTKSSFLYFDNIKSINDERFVPSTIWKSVDFDAYLWYIIHKSTQVLRSSENKTYWDNRLTIWENFRDAQKKGDTDQVNDLKSSYKHFFEDENLGPGGKLGITKITSNQGNISNKKNILICGYEQRSDTINNNVLKIWLNPNRYQKRVSFNKKILESSDLNNKTLAYVNAPITWFNYDFLYSVKIIDPASFSFNLINKFYGLIPHVSFNASLDVKMAAEEMMEWADEIVETYDGTVNDCFFKFDNTKYEEIIERVNKNYSGKYSYNSDNERAIDEFEKEVTIFKEKGEEVPSLTDINRLINKISSIKGDDKYVGVDSINIKSGFGFNNPLNGAMIKSKFKEFLQTFARELVLSILQPKVVLLYTINTKFFGDITNVGEYKELKIKDIISNLKTVLRDVITEVLNLLFSEIYNIILKYFKQMLSLYIYKLALERIQVIIKMYESFENCLGNFSLNFARKNLNVADVNYADIIDNGDYNKLENNCS